jgi:hypothetical protein
MIDTQCLAQLLKDVVPRGQTEFVREPGSDERNDSAFSDELYKRLRYVHGSSCRDLELAEAV